MISKAIEIFINNRPLFINGAKNTIILSFVGTLIGLFFGFVLSMIRNIKIEDNDPALIKLIKRVGKLCTVTYIEFVRGTPMMVQAVFLYYGLNGLLHWAPMTAGVVVISLNTTAYMAEILRAGIQSVDKGQTQAALALGMKPNTAFIKIVFPQALRNAFPSMGNELIANVKDSSVLNAIQVTELYYQAIAYAGRTYLFAESMFVLLIVYFIITFISSRILQLIEQRLAKTTITHIERGK